MNVDEHVLFSIFCGFEHDDMKELFPLHDMVLLVDDIVLHLMYVCGLDELQHVDCAVIGKGNGEVFSLLDLLHTVLYIG